MLSFLKLVKSWPKNAVWNLAVCCGAIWRRRKNRNIGAQLQSITCIKAPKTFWKIYFLYDFWCAQTFHSEPFLDYLYKFWQLLPVLYSNVRKKIIYMHIYILGPTLLQWNFLQISQLSIRSHVQKLFRQFWTFRNFWTQFHKNFGAPSTKISTT